MASTNINVNSAQGSQLPVPKVRLSSKDQYVKLTYYRPGTNSTQGSFLLKRFPEVVTMDLDSDIIDNGVYVEMLVYKPGKSGAAITYGADYTSAYVIPPPSISGVNMFSGFSTRGSVSPQDINVDKINHFKVNTVNEVIPVWEYINNRFSLEFIRYRDTSGNYQSVELLIPCNRRNRFSIFGKSFMYSALYSPLYICFRYVMINSNNDGFISGPVSRVVKIAHDVHPFLVDPVASNDINASCGIINPIFLNSEMRCYFETRLP